MNENTLLRNDEIIAHLRVLMLGDQSLKSVPGMVGQIIDEDMWQERILGDSGQRVTYANFVEFVEDDVPFGLGVQLKTLLRLCDDTPEVKKKILTLMPPLGEQGGDRKNNQGSNTTLNNSQDRGSAYKLRRLKRDNPKLAQKVIEGELSATKAAIQAGISTRKVALNMDNPESAARTIYKYMSEENIADLIDRLLEMLRHD